MTKIVQPRLIGSANRRRLWEPLVDAIGRHVLKRQEKFADDTLVKMQAPRARQSIDGIRREVNTGKTKTAGFWTYARDEWPWAGDAPPAAWTKFNVDCKGMRTIGHLKHHTGWMHADGYAGFEELHRSSRIHEVAYTISPRAKAHNKLTASR